jgi:ABC-type transport system involved in cytochrome bd biosynthesis fused ATPase/permease subunit
MNVAHEQLAAMCADLKLSAVADAAVNLAQEASAAEWTYLDFLDRVLRAETAQRQSRSRSMLVRTAGFPVVKRLEDFDFSFAGANKKQFTELAGLAFVERGENLVLLGPSGVGKTHLAWIFRSCEASIPIDGKPAFRSMGSQWRRRGWGWWLKSRRRVAGCRRQGQFCGAGVCASIRR